MGGNTSQQNKSATPQDSSKEKTIQSFTQDLENIYFIDCKDYFKNNGSSQLTQFLEFLNPRQKISDVEIKFLSDLSTWKSLYTEEEVQTILNEKEKLEKNLDSMEELQANVILLLEKHLKNHGIRTGVRTNESVVKKKQENINLIIDNTYNKSKQTLTDDQKVFSNRTGNGIYYRYIVQKHEELKLDFQNRTVYEDFVIRFKKSISQEIFKNYSKDLRIVIFNAHLKKQDISNKKAFIDFYFIENDEHLIISDKDLQGLQKKNSISNYILDLDIFDQKYTRTWEEQQFKTMVDYRGAIQHPDKSIKKQQYFFPVGYTGIGLNLKGKYPGDDKWFSMNGDIDTWIVLYHGTNSPDNVVSIINYNLDPTKNKRHAFANYPCRFTGKKIPSDQCVYLADKVEQSEIYSVNDVAGNKYSLIFQCRVNPKGVYSPVSCPDYYIVLDPNDIRAYRILIKKL